MQNYHITCICNSLLCVTCLFQVHASETLGLIESCELMTGLDEYMVQTGHCHRSGRKCLGWMMGKKIYIYNKNWCFVGKHISTYPETAS